MTPTTPAMTPNMPAVEHQDYCKFLEMQVRAACGLRAGCVRVDMRVDMWAACGWACGWACGLHAGGLLPPCGLCAGGSLPPCGLRVGGRAVCMRVGSLPL